MSEVKRFYEKISKNQTVYQEVRIWYKDAHHTDMRSIGFVHENNFMPNLFTLAKHNCILTLVSF